MFSVDDMMSDILEHHGVKGQKWGVKRAGRIAGRVVKNAETNQAKRQLNRAKQHASGVTLKAKAGKAVIGSDRMQKHMNTKVSAAKLQHGQLQRGTASIHTQLKVLNRTDVFDLIGGSVKTVREVKAGKV